MVRPKDVFSEAYRSLRHNRLRSALTMLGMAWGIATVVLLLAYGTGFSTAIVNSTYIDQMSEYDTLKHGVNGHKGTNQDIGRGTSRGVLHSGNIRGVSDPRVELCSTSFSARRLT